MKYINHARSCGPFLSGVLFLMVTATVTWAHPNGMETASRDDIRSSGGGEDIRPGDRSKRGEGRPGRGAGQGKAGEKLKAFKAVDANGDGVLTFEEFSQLGRLANMENVKRRKLFDYLDRNNDGQLQMREIHAHEPGWMTQARKQFLRLDLDKSGSLDSSEFAKLSALKDKDQAVVERIFTKADRNKNGTLERHELKTGSYQRPRPHIDFSKFDKNASGGLDFAEYSSLPWMEKVPEERKKHLFDRIDSNNDGEISRKEVRTAHQRHRGGAHSKPHRGERSREGQGNRPGKAPGKPKRKPPEKSGPDSDRDANSNP